MGAQGTATLDFGAFPGSNVAYTDVVTAGVISTSAVEAWIRPVDTADHTAEDHVAAQMKVVGLYVSAGNIRIYGINTNNVIPPIEGQPEDPFGGLSSKKLGRKINIARQSPPMFVGQFSVWWVWN